MDSLQKISNDLVQSINEKEKKKSIPYDTYAKVIRIDGGTAWVHIPGGVDETPVAMTVNAKVGDSVLVRVSGGNAWIVGNSSAPPTDDTKAVEAKGVADVAQVKAASAQETAESAEEIAKDASRAVKSTSQYFWHTETDTGAGAGAHITEIPQEDFLDDPANGGANLLARSGGIAVRKGKQEVAQFGDTVVLGKDDGSQSYMSLDYHSMQMIDNEGRVYFHVSDLKNADGNIVDKFEGDGETTVFEVAVMLSSVVSVTIDDEPTSDWTRSGEVFTFNSAPTGIVTITYVPNMSVETKSFTAGQREPNAPVGAGSFSEGRFNVASGQYSHAEGYNNKATGGISHAEGQGNTASGTRSHTEGTNNTASGNYSHAEGLAGVAQGDYSHAEGLGNTARGIAAHAEGASNSAIGDYSHAQNRHNTARYENQTVIGRYNDNKSDTAFEIGNGSGGIQGQKSNAFEVDWQGNVDMAGMLQSFFSIVDLKVAVGQVAAHAQSNIGTVTVPTEDRPDGMTLVGIVGVACNNYRVVPYNYYVTGAHSITCAVVNTTTAQSATGTTMTFKLLYAKMASA